jgi:hypothetical protein
MSNNLNGKPIGKLETLVEGSSPDQGHDSDELEDVVPNETGGKDEMCCDTNQL